MDEVRERQTLTLVDKPASIQKGWFIQYKNGATAFVYSDPIHWPPSIIQRVQCIRPMMKPVEQECNCINCTDGEAA